MKKKRIIPVLLGLLILLGGCKEKETTVPSTPEEGGYSVYYRNAAESALTEKKVTCKESEEEAIADFLVEQMRNDSDRSDQYMSVIPDTAVYYGCEQQGDVMYLSFDSFYHSLTVPEQVLFQAALTKTMVQIPGIDYISIQADGQPLMDAGGNPIGFLEATDFVDVLGRDVNTVNRTTLVLYYANEAGDALVTEKYEATYSSSFSIEEYIVEQLIDGPEKEGCYPSVPSGTKVISVTTKDNICYVNLDDRFMEGKLDVAASIPIYSIVNSLTELSNVKSVQITIEGSSDINYRNEISLQAPLSRNLDYVEMSK